MVYLNNKQFSAIVRLNREYTIKDIEIENVDLDERKKVRISITLNIKSEKKKSFYLDDDGALAGVIKDNGNEGS